MFRNLVADQGRNKLFPSNGILCVMAAQLTFRRVLLLALAVLGAIIVVNGTEVMHRPDGYKSPPNTFKIEEDPTTHVIQKRATANVQVAYFTNW
jgi:chitinase